MAKSWRRRSPFQGKKFRPFALAIGQMNMAWNDLHEDLGLLFQRIFLQTPMQIGMPGRVRTAWGLISSDRQKRILLEGLADHLGEARHRKFPTLADDLKFLAKCGTRLEDKRNDVIHAPILALRNALAAGLLGQEYGEVVANTLNHRGRKLAGPASRSGRELLATIRLYRDYATALSVYAEAIRFAWIAREAGRRRAWPKRPPLPRLKD